MHNCIILLRGFPDIRILKTKIPIELHVPYIKVLKILNNI